MLMDHSAEPFADTAPSTGPGVVRALWSATISMFRRRWRIFAVVAIVTFVVAAALILMMPWKYQAVARVKIDPSPSAALGQMSGERPDQNIFDTEVNVMRSRNIALAVVDRLKLASDPAFTKGMKPLPATATPAQREKRDTELADRLLGKLSTARDKMTYIVNVGFTASDPRLAADVANAFANEYIAYSVGRRTGTASRETSYLDQRLAALNQQAMQADARLAQYRAQTGIVSGGDATVTDQQISPLASQLATAESEAAAAQARLRVARAQIASGGIDAVSAVLNSQVIADLRSQRAQVIQRQGEVSARYGPRHPETIKVSEQLTAIDRQIKDEASRIIGGLESEANAAQARAASLRGDMGRLRGQQSTDTRASVIADNYQRQADAAHAAYNKLAEQAQQMNQVARSSLSQAQVIESAVTPEAPSSPNRRMLLMLAGLGAMVLGAMSVVTREVLASGIYSTRDVEALGLPVLASVPRIRSSKLRNAAGERCAAPALLLEKPMSSYAETFRVLRHALSSGPARQGARVVALLSSLPDEGKTSSALALARICALAGEKVLLIDTDLRRAGMLAAANIRPEAGLIEVLTGQRPVDEVIIPDQLPGLDLLPVASNSFMAEDLFSGEGMQALLRDMAARYDRIILDTAPLLGVAESRTIARLVDAAILVIKWGDTPVNAVKSALNGLAQDGVPLIGALFSMVDAGEEAYGALYYSSKYNAYYRSE